MAEDTARVRLRQAVIVAAELEPVASSLRHALGLGEPFRDAGVGEFGLANAVFAIGDCFLEVISPMRAGTAAGRYLERNGGDGGYMLIFDVEDLDGARARAQSLGVRVIWRIDLPDISATHLHPSDMRGAIVSIDRFRPYGSWRWGGPAWTGTLARPAGGSLAGVSVAVADPAAVAGRWGAVLGVTVSGGAQPRLELDGGEVHFQEGEGGLFEIAVLAPDAPAQPGADELGGVLFRRLDAGA